MDRRLWKLAPSVAVATLALMTAAWAATGEVPLAPGEPRRPLALAAGATGPLVADDHDGSAVLTADAMAPGATEAGEVTIANAGDAAGAFSLAPGAPVDTGAGLSAILGLTVSDVTEAAPVTLYDGTLARFRGLVLGRLDAGAARRYRFAVTYPAGRPAAMDDPYQGASAALDLTWSAVALPSAPAPAPAPVTPVSPAPTPAPAPAAPAASAPATAAPDPAPTTPTAPPAPATTALPALTVTVGAAANPVAGGRLVTWLQSSTAATAHVTGTVSYAGSHATLKPATVNLAAGTKRTVRVRLPAAALAPKRRLTVRLAVTATAGTHATTATRTLRVTAP